MKYSKAGIYVDGYELLKLLKRAQYTMTKTDRVIYGTPVLKANTDFLAAFVMAYDFEEERWYYIKKMCSTFEVLKMQLRIISEENILKVTTHENANMKPDSLKLQIFTLVGRIDEGITKWRRSFRAS